MCKNLMKEKIDIDKLLEKDVDEVVDYIHAQYSKAEYDWKENKS